MRRYSTDGSERPTSKLIAHLDVLHAKAQIKVTMMLLDEVDAQIKELEGMRMQSLTHEECDQGDEFQTEVMARKIYRPGVEREAKIQYRRILLGMQQEFAEEEMEASLHYEDLTAE